jgi:hypothetical protein
MSAASRINRIARRKGMIPKAQRHPFAVGGGVVVVPPAPELPVDPPDGSGSVPPGDVGVPGA